MEPLFDSFKPLSGFRTRSGPTSLAGQGLSAEEFAQLVDHDEDTTEEELREVLARLQRRDLRKSEQRRSQRRSERRFSVRSWGRKSFVKSEEELRRWGEESEKQVGL